jgi:pimeloyl-ACP methyl ester carboxylesterase
MDPVAESIEANGLAQRVLRWGEAASSLREAGARTRSVVLLLHGYMDAAGTFQGVAPELARQGHVVYAPDFRGFGAGARAPAGAYYHFADYIFDLAEIVRAVTRDDTPLDVVGHSMGGTVATLFTGSFPERVRKMATLEGLGPPEIPVDLAPGRMKRWIEEVRKIRSSTPTSTSTSTSTSTPTSTSTSTSTMSEDDALRRLAINHARIPVDILRAQLPHLTRRTADGLAWAFDPLHKTPSPTPFSATVYRAFARAVTCPVLFVSGGALGYHPPDEEERLASFSQLTRKELPNAGHMMHWTEPLALAEILRDFLS